MNSTHIPSPCCTSKLILSVVPLGREYDTEALEVIRVPGFYPVFTDG